MIAEVLLVRNGTGRLERSSVVGFGRQWRQQQLPTTRRGPHAMKHEEEDAWVDGKAWDGTLFTVAQHHDSGMTPRRRRRKV